MRVVKEKEYTPITMSFDWETLTYLESLAEEEFDGNRSAAVRHLLREHKRVAYSNPEDIRL